MTHTKPRKHQLQLHRPFGWLVILIIITVLGFIYAISAGKMVFSFNDYLLAFANPDNQDMAARVIHELRLPRAILAFITGALLAVAGALLQVLLRNPLADPYVLGISGGAAVFALVALVLGLAGWQLNLAAFCGAMLAMLLVFGLARGYGGWTPTRLLLTGVVLAAGWGAVISFILSIAPESQLRGMLFWLMGDLAYATHPLPGLVILVSGLCIALFMSRDLNVLALGPLQAGALGVNVDRMHWQL